MTTVWSFAILNAERYADRNRVMLVVPNVANSFGVDTSYGRNYSTFITEELSRRHSFPFSILARAGR